MIVAGHIGTSTISEDPFYNDIYWDGEEYGHLFCDGNVLDSGVIPVLLIDLEKNKFYQMSANGPWSIFPYGMDD